MTLDSVIERLKELREKHGNIEVHSWCNSRQVDMFIPQFDNGKTYIPALILIGCR